MPDLSARLESLLDIIEDSSSVSLRSLRDRQRQAQRTPNDDIHRCFVSSSQKLFRLGDLPAIRGGRESKLLERIQTRSGGTCLRSRGQCYPRSYMYFPPDRRLKAVDRGRRWGTSFSRTFVIHSITNPYAAARLGISERKSEHLTNRRS
jgi:hypothetical protein